MSTTLFLGKPSLSNLARNSLRRFAKNSNTLPFENVTMNFLLDMILPNSSMYSLSLSSFKLLNSLTSPTISATGSHFSFFERVATNVFFGLWKELFIFP